MAEIGMNDLMVAIKDVAADVKTLNTKVGSLEHEVKTLNTRVGSLENEVKTLNSRVSNLETEQATMRKEMNENFRRMNKKLSILSDEILDARTDITFLEEKVN